MFYKRWSEESWTCSIWNPPKMISSCLKSNEEGQFTSVCTLQTCSSPSQYRSQVSENLSVLPSLLLLSSESMYNLFPCQKHYSADLCSPGCDSQSSSGKLVETWQRWLSQCLGRCHHSGKLSKLKYDLYRSWANLEKTTH